LTRFHAFLIPLRRIFFLIRKLESIANMAPSDVSDLNAWIELLMSCKQLPENDVKKLCEKVGYD
jgi:serine/threonine-protein phosphatase 2A catalytic subunit